jgi:hypothetical protein
LYGRALPPGPQFRRTPVALLGLALGALLVTKLHFWLCVAAPVLAMLAGETGRLPRERRRWLGGSLLLLLPSLALGGAYWWTVRGTANYFAPAAERAPPLLLAVARGLRDFSAGMAHRSFWGVFGWLDTPLQIHDPATTSVVRFVIHVIAWALLALTLVRIGQVACRLVRVARKGRPWPALRAALSNPVLNGYFAFTALMLFLYVRTGNRIGAQGRNWLPFLLPIFLAGLVYAPKALPRRPARVVFAALAAGLLLYGVVGNHYARATLRERYYAPVPAAAGEVVARQ